VPTQVQYEQLKVMIDDALASGDIELRYTTMLIGGARISKSFVFVWSSTG
jgi:hypothetical protein